MDRWDWIVTVGVVCLAVGLGMRALWLAPTTVGVCLLGFGLFGAAGDHDGEGKS